MSDNFEVKLRYFPTSAPLRRYFANFVYAEVSIKNCSHIEDWLFPDWAILHFHIEPESGGDTSDDWGDGACKFFVAGPRSRAARYKTGSMRQWGLTLHPLGWALLSQVSADKYANRVVDGMTDDVFANFRPLAATLFAGAPDVEKELERINCFCERLIPNHEPHAQTISEIYLSAIDPDLESVSMLAQRVGIGRRMLERLCKRTFGFSPKQLLRRQRFMRSLMHFSSDKSGKWIDAIDAHYYDQAQFVRDFREIMGTTPSEYDLHSKPVTGPLMRDRERYFREITRQLRNEGDLRDYRVGY